MSHYLYSQDVARRRIDAFEKRFGELHLVFACHAAFPVAFSFELLHDIWANFYSDIHKRKLEIPEIAIADFLLSDLCHQIDNEFYEVDIEIRNMLLEHLRNDSRFGSSRIRELAEFLFNCTYKELVDEHNELYDLAEAQWFTSLAYSRPRKAAYEIVLKYMRVPENDKAELLRMCSLLEMLKEPLFEEFQPLFVYSGAMRLFAFGQVDQAAEMIKTLMNSNRQVRIAGITLALAKEIDDKIRTLSAEQKTNYSHADLQGQSFAGQNLTGADFSYANIRGVDFTGAILKNANFQYSKLGIKNSWLTAFIIFSSVASIASIISLGFVGFILEGSIFESHFLFLFGLISFSITLFLIFRYGVEPNIGTLCLAFAGIQSLYIGFLIPVWGSSGRSISGLSLTLSGFMIIFCAASLIKTGNWRWTGNWSIFGIIILSLLLSGVSIYIFSVSIALNGTPDFITITLLSIAVLTETVASIIILTISVNLIASISKAWSYAVGIVWPVCIAFIVSFYMRNRIFLGDIVQMAPALVSIIFVVRLAQLARSGDKRFTFIQQATSFFSTFAGTRFENAYLTEADFTQATLEGGNFRNADLTRTCWFQVKQLHKAFFTEPYLIHSTVRELLVTGLGNGGNFDFLPLEGINLHGANLENASFFHSDLSSANLQDANLFGAMLKQTKLDKADLSGATLTGACIENWEISSTQLDGIDCDFVYIKASPGIKRYTKRLPEGNEIFERGEFADFAKYS